jgi:hypothetical protein
MEFNRSTWRRVVDEARKIRAREMAMLVREDAAPLSGFDKTTVEVEARLVLDLEMAVVEAEQILSLLNSDEAKAIREVAFNRRLKEAISEVQVSIRTRGEA